MQQLNNIQPHTPNQNEKLNSKLNNTTTPFSLGGWKDNNLQKVIFSKGQVNIEELQARKGVNISTLSRKGEEDFSWLMDDKGNLLDFNKKVNLFNGVSLISNFLEKKYGIQKNEISYTSPLSLGGGRIELISIFSENNERTVLQLFDHVSKLYKEDKNSFSQIVSQLTTAPNTNNQESTKAITDNFLNTWNSNRPLGDFGETTTPLSLGGWINEVAVGLKNLRPKGRDVVFANTQITLNAVPIASNAIGYGIIIKNYLRHVHNRPFAPYLNEIQMKSERLLRNKQLAAFSLLGAPLILFSIKYSGLAMIPIPLGQGVDMLTFNIFGSSHTPTVISDNSEVLNSGLFLIINKIKNKLPKWLKLLFGLLFISLILINKFGLINILKIIFDGYYLKLFILSYSFIIILYIFFVLYLVYLFSKKKIQISEVLPDFIINWLKLIEIMCSSKEGIQAIKNLYYRELVVYLLVITVVFILS